jgi:hypothetical protein
MSINCVDIREDLMFAEGSAPSEPNKTEIQGAMKRRGYVATDIHIFYDNFQHFWRFNSKIKKGG